MTSELKFSLKKRNPISYHSIQGRKPSQEDSFFISPKIDGKQLLFVADGVGGHGHGDFASQLCVNIFENTFEQLRFFHSIPDFLRKTALVVAASVLDKGRNEPEFKRCGTTLSGFFIDGNEFYTINIGDSRVYHYAINNLKQLTKDQSKVQELIDSGVITEEEALVHPERNMMTSAIGQSLEMLRIDIEGPIPIQNGEFLLAMSDGVPDSLRDKDIKNIIEKNLASEELAKILVESAYNAGGTDNITAIVYRHETV